MRIESETTRAYVERVNRAIDHVLAHLDGPLPLAEVAEVAGFSSFHFHRVFRGVMRETLQQFVKRVRLERALRLLARGRGSSLTEVALACGFSSSSDFSRSFRQRYGVPPSAFDLDTFRAQRRADWQAVAADERTRHLLERLPAGENPDGFEVRLRRLPARRVAYVRVLEPFRPDAVPAAAARLVDWATERGLADGQWLGSMWDDPDLVAAADCRYDVGLELPRDRDVAVGGEVGELAFPPMLLAEVDVRGGLDLEQRALDWLFDTWLPASGHVPTDQPCFEAWHGRPYEHGLEHFELSVQLPVAPA